jgi:ubiquinone/menaquinone biosynthesis C-methylase UbiE
MVKTRGLEEAKVKLGDLEEIIVGLLKKKDKIKIFESGCGWGKVMVQLKKKFGNKIEITGLNFLPIHGDKKKILSFALEEGIIKKEEINEIKPIKLIFGDASKKLPFNSGSIDLVYSQTSVYLYPDKMHFFEEVSRILSKEGVARITLPASYNENVPEELKNLLRIYKEGIEIKFEDFIKKFKQIKIIDLPNGKKAIEIHSGKLDFKLKLISHINLNEINKKWFGLVSIYSVK